MMITVLAMLDDDNCDCSDSDDEDEEDPDVESKNVFLTAMAIVCYYVNQASMAVDMLGWLERWFL